MKSSPAARFLLAGLIALSLGGKVLASRQPPPVDQSAFEGAAKRFLGAHGYAVSVTRHKLGSVIHGERPGCRVMLGDYLPTGVNAHLLRTFAAPSQPMRYAFAGTLYDEVPKARLIVRSLAERELFRAGIDLGRKPLVAVAATPGCELAALPWSSLGTLSR